MRRRILAAKGAAMKNTLYNKVSPDTVIVNLDCFVEPYIKRAYLWSKFKKKKTQKGFMLTHNVDGVVIVVFVFGGKCRKY